MGLRKKIVGKTKVAAAPVAAAPSDLHPFAQKLPMPKRTGNHSYDEDMEAKALMLKEMLSTCLLDLSHVPPLYAKMRERVRQQASPNEDIEFRDVKALRGLDPDFVVDFITRKSDLMLEEVIALMKKDSDAPLQIMAFGVQLPLSLRWPPALFSREATYRFLNQRTKEAGNRLEKIKGHGTVARGALTWAKGCYKPSFDHHGRMEKVTHWNGDVVIVPPELHINKTNAAIVDNWSDTAAAISQPLISPVKFINLFASSNTGPYKYNIYQKKCPELDRAIQEIVTEYEDEKRNCTSASSSGVHSAAENIEELKSQQAKERAKRARAKAAEARSNKRTKNHIAIT